MAGLFLPSGIFGDKLDMAKLPQGVSITAKRTAGDGRVLTPKAIIFVAELSRAFESERQRLLGLRGERQRRFNRGDLPDFLAETSAIRAGSWRIAAIPSELQDRRVEITAPTERKAMIEAFNSGAKTFAAGFESLSTWDDMIRGQINLMDRWTGKMEYIEPITKKRHGLAGKPAVLLVQPRGLDLDETHMRAGGKPVAAGIFDFGLYFFHNAKTSCGRASGPYFHLAGLESHLEARLWNHIFVHAQSLLGLPLGTIKASVSIETIAAVFEMDEIIFELRDHMAGLRCGDANAAGSALAVKTCHRRGCLSMAAQAMGPEQAAFLGHDGIGADSPVAAQAFLQAFNELMPTANQLYVAGEDRPSARKELLANFTYAKSAKKIHRKG